MELNEQQAFLAQLDALKDEGAALQRANAATQRKLMDLLRVPEQTAIRVDFDELGLISEMEIDEQVKSELTPQQLGREINLAVLRASGSVVPTPSMPGGNSQDAPADLTSPDSILGQLMGILATGERPEPVEVPNDLGTVTIRALWGNLVEVTCTESWILSTPGHLIAEEIVRMGRIAARETDILRRFPK